MRAKTNYPYFSGITGGRGSCIYSANIATYAYSNSNIKLAKDNLDAMKTALFIKPLLFWIYTTKFSFNGMAISVFDALI